MIKCPYCNRPFSNEPALRLHLRDAHDIGLGSVENFLGYDERTILDEEWELGEQLPWGYVEGLGVYKCKICGWKTKSRKDMARHLAKETFSPPV